MVSSIKQEIKKIMKDYKLSGKVILSGEIDEVKINVLTRRLEIQPDKMKQKVLYEFVYEGSIGLLYKINDIIYLKSFRGM